jgi:hypothetical protein
MGQHQKDVKHLETNGKHAKEIDGGPNAGHDSPGRCATFVSANTAHKNVTSSQGTVLSEIVRSGMSMIIALA